MKKVLYNTTIPGIRMVLFILICCWCALANAQANNGGSIGYLTAANGFANSLILGEDIKNLQGAKLSYLDGDSRADADSCLKYAYNDEHILPLGDSLSLDMVGIRAYKDKIVNIYLFFKRADAYKVLDNFIKSYGQFTDRPDNYNDIYNWNTSLLSLSLRYEYKTDIGIAVFTNKKLESEMEADKQKAATARLDYQALSLNQETPADQQ